MMDLEKQIELVRRSDLSDKERTALEKASMFHGHICPGLAMGVSVSLIYMDDRSRSSDEELVAVVENDACGVDGIQSLTGCTFGKGNLIFKDHGKSVYTFFDRKTGEGIRYSMKGDALGDLDERSRELVSRVRSGDPTEKDLEEFNSLWAERALDVILRRNELFNGENVKEALPEKARIFESFNCRSCGERTGAHRAVEIGGDRYCIPCSREVKE